MAALYFDGDVPGLGGGFAFGDEPVLLPPGPGGFIVEDGTGLPDAESYASVLTATQYHSARGNAAWATLSKTKKEVALRRATDYLDQAFGGRWVGYRAHDTQALDWPRIGVARRDRPSVAGDVVPGEIVRACCEMALRSIAGPLLQDEGAQVKSESIGPISTVYADGARQQTRFAAVDALLRSLLRPQGIRLVRA